MSGAAPWRAGAGQVLLDVRLTPRSSADRIEGTGALADGRAVLLVRVRAVPEDGKANAALVQLLAKTLGVGRSSVVLVSGGMSRVKTIRIDGDPAAIVNALETAGAS